MSERANKLKWSESVPDRDGWRWKCRFCKHRSMTLYSAPTGSQMDSDFLTHFDARHTINGNVVSDK